MLYWYKKLPKGHSGRRYVFKSQHIQPLNCRNHFSSQRQRGGNHPRTRQHQWICIDSDPMGPFVGGCNDGMYPLSYAIKDYGCNLADTNFPSRQICYGKCYLGFAVTTSRVTCYSLLWRSGFARHLCLLEIGFLPSLASSALCR